jgi:hypothetical protein
VPKIIEMPRSGTARLSEPPSIPSTLRTIGDASHYPQKRGHNGNNKRVANNDGNKTALKVRFSEIHSKKSEKEIKCKIYDSKRLRPHGVLY